MTHTDGLDAGRIFSNLEALLPEIAARAPEIAALRQLPDDLVGALKRAGAFRLPMPRSWGGPEMSLPDQLRLVKMVAMADPSVAWCVMIGSDAGFYSSFLDDTAGRELWPDLDMVTAGWVVPAGQARRVDGGFVVNGRWSFGSGCTHADVLAGGCLVVDADGVPEIGEDGLPRRNIVLASADRWEILDTWYTTGLAGSGSNDYTCTNLFVPEAHTFALDGPVRRPGPLYRLPGAFFANVHGVPLGLARRAIDEVIGISATKVLVPELLPMRDVPRVRAAVAEAEAQLRSTRAYAYDTMAAVWEALVADEPLADSLRADLVLSRLQCFRVAEAVALRMVQLAGTQAIFATSVLDRLVRDAITLNRHIVAGPAMQEAAGALALGLQPEGLLAALI